MLHERDLPQTAHDPLTDDPLTDEPGPDRAAADTVSALAVPAIASAAAAVLHATAAGIHADHPTLSRIFVAFAVAQAAVAVGGFLRQSRAAAISLVAVNLLAAAGWVVTRLAGISWIDGLELAERPQLADSITAAMAMIAAVGAAAIWFEHTPALPRRAVANVGLLAGVLVVPGLINATTHDHATHAEGSATDADADHGHADAATVAVSGGVAGGTAAAASGDGDTDHGHDATAEPAATAGSEPAHGHATASAGDGSTAAAGEPAALAWPRAWDPSKPFDFSGVPGVTPEQQARAEQLVKDALRDLPQFADVTTIGALGYKSIGDAGTGWEHYVNYALLGDDKFLDPNYPESLVYQVDGESRTLVSAMFISANTDINDPKLLDYGGYLMQWHVHTDLCWKLDANGKPQVVAVLADLGDVCPEGSANRGGDAPMVHVWIAPHECGPFAALEGAGAGQAAVPNAQRVDQCNHAHDEGHGTTDAAAEAASKPYDPALPIDLGGVPGVTPQQQAFAENLVAATLRDLPQWSDPEVAEAAGFRSIGDGFLGHEHYINWDWIDDDVWLDPDQPESLVFEPQPDGSKKLVSAMFMLPSATPFEQIPDWGGALMQWHVHGDLCFTNDPEAPQVAGLKPVGGTCQPPLVDFLLSPMIHVWITSTPCGPFAALDGVAGGQVPEGEDVLCDTAHGSH
jgi:hypothetical protein